MNPSITERLSRIRVFQTLDNNALEHIAPFFVHHAFVRGQCILTHGERSTAVYFLTEGRVRATLYSPTGREVSYQDLKPGEMFGELAALDQLPRSMHVIGLTAGSHTHDGHADKLLAAGAHHIAADFAEIDALLAR